VVEVAETKRRKRDHSGTGNTYNTSVQFGNWESKSELNCLQIEGTSKSCDVPDIRANSEGIEISHSGGVRPASIIRLSGFHTR